MENLEGIEVDAVGVEQQRREEILNSEHFVDIRIVVGEDYSEPVVQANVKGSPMMLATALACLRDVEKSLVKRSGEFLLPLIELIEHSLTSTTIDVEENKE